jgi:hypothetical protein
MKNWMVITIPEVGTEVLVDSLAPRVIKNGRLILAVRLIPAEEDTA